MQVCPKREVEEDLSYFEDEPGTTISGQVAQQG